MKTLRPVAVLAHLGASLLLAQPGFAEGTQCPELPGFAPLAELPVYANSCLYGAEDAGFSSLPLVSGPMKGRAMPPNIALEGDLQRRLYVAPEGVSARDLFQNYKNALQDAGFVTIFECLERECGSPNALLGKTIIYPAERKLRNLGGQSEFALYIKGEEHYLAARSQDGTRHIAIYVAQNQDKSISKGAAGRAAVHIDLVTSAALQSKMIDAEAMAKGILDEGHIALDNVYFDFGTAVLSAQSQPALDEMVKLLTAQPDLRVAIVGHTDWVGDEAANRALSQDRAKAVVGALVAAGIAPARLRAEGLGMMAPRASNGSEAGRALNRRVELVELP